MDGLRKEISQTMSNKMKVFYLVLLFMSFISMKGIYAQEKFLFVELVPKNEEGAIVKNHEVSVTTPDEIDFIINTKRKKTSFYLQPGLKYHISVTAKNNHTTYCTVDLIDVPKELFEISNLELLIQPTLYPQHKDRAIPVLKYKYSPRYKKVIPEVS